MTYGRVKAPSGTLRNGQRRPARGGGERRPSTGAISRRSCDITLVRRSDGPAGKLVEIRMAGWSAAAGASTGSLGKRVRRWPCRPQRRRAMNLGRGLSALRRRWVVLLVFVLAGAALGAYRSARTEPTYRSTTTVFFSLTRTQTVGELAQGSAYLQALVTSYAQVTTSRLVLTPVIDQLQLEESESQLNRRIRAKARPNTSLMDITVTGRTPEGAAEVANALALQLRSAVASLSPRSSAKVAAVTV